MSMVTKGAVSISLSARPFGAVLREHEDWGARTALTPALLEATATQDANELVHRLYTPDWPRSKVATLAPVVDSIAESGDPVAIDIMNGAAQHLAMLSAVIRRQLFREGEPSRLAWIGGVFRSSMLLDRFRMLTGLEGSVTVGPPDHAPASGALIMAYKAAGLNVVPEPTPNLKV